MFADFTQVWVLVVICAAFCGWWLSLRPNASFRNIGGTMQMLIGLMIVLMCLLALDGQQSLLVRGSPPPNTVALGVSRTPLSSPQLPDDMIPR